MERAGAAQERVPSGSRPLRGGTGGVRAGSGCPTSRSWGAGTTELRC